MARNERTSARVAKIASLILRADKKTSGALLLLIPKRGGGNQFVTVLWSDMCALAASALTQAPDKPKRSRRHPIDRERGA